MNSRGRLGYGALALSLMMAGTTPALAQFGPVFELTETLDEPFAGMLSDLDGDGDLDIVATSWTSQRDVWYPNLGGGNFGPQRILAEGTFYTFAFVTEDLDGDSILDIAATDNGGTIRWYRGLGAGQFASAQPIATNLNSGIVLVASDLDLDGDLDLVHGSLASGVSFLANLGGTFAAPVLLTGVGSQAYSLVAGDVDGDGLEDLIFGNLANDSIQWLRNTGGLTFAPVQSIQGGLVGLSDFALEDLDSDGDLDLIAVAEQAGQLNGRVARFENLGAGTFSLRQEISTLNRPWRIDLVDVDGDLDRDLLVAYHHFDGVLWYENQGAGVFQGAESIVPNTVGDGVRGGDLDGDGRPDVLSMTDAHSIAWHRNTGTTPRFGPPRAITKTTADVRDLAVADFDGDGDVDVVSASLGDDRLAYFEHLAGADFGDMVTIDDDCDGCHLVRAGDIDADGDQDVVYTSVFGREVFLRVNTGGTFGPRQSLATMVNIPNDLELADLDGDGDLDVVVLAGQVSILANLGGTFAPPFSLNGLSLPIALELGDLSGDALPDIAALSFNQSSVRWYRNLGGLNFAAPLVASGFIDEPADLALADVDADGDLDPVWVTGFASSLSWSENLGNGTFGSDTLIAFLPSFGVRVDAFDLDSDGDDDLVVCLWTSNGVYWYQNLGGSFAPRELITNFTYDPAGTASADMDGDGDLDVIVASSGTNQILWARSNHVPVIGNPECGPGVPNSTGVASTIFASGSVVVGADDLVLHGRDLPPRQFAIFVTSLVPTAPMPLANSVGDFCLGGTLGRLNRPAQILQASLAGSVQLEVGTQGLPQGGVLQPVLAGQSWYFQLWHREASPTLASNLSNSIRVSFL